MGKSTKAWGNVCGENNNQLLGPFSERSFEKNSLWLMWSMEHMLLPPFGESTSVQMEILSLFPDFGLIMTQDKPCVSVSSFSQLVHWAPPVYQPPVLDISCKFPILVFKGLTVWWKTDRQLDSYHCSIQSLYM